MAGRPYNTTKYKTPKALHDAIEHYFASISYTVPMHSKDTGDIITNDEGCPIMQRMFAIPPTVCGMCLSLGIDRSTWQNYCNNELHPEFIEVTGKAKAVLESWLEQELLSRQGNVRGLVFALQNNCGWREKKEVDLGAETRNTLTTEAMTIDQKLKYIADTRQMMEEDAGGQSK